MDQPGKVANPARGQLNRENNIPLSPCVSEDLVSRDGFSLPVPRQPAQLHTQAESGAYLRDSYQVPRWRPFMKPPYAIGSVPTLSGHAFAYQWRSLPRVHRHRVSKPQGSSERVLPWQVTMDQLIFASLSHTHYWYEVGMWKVPAMRETWTSLKFHVFWYTVCCLVIVAGEIFSELCVTMFVQGSPLTAQADRETSAAGLRRVLKLNNATLRDLIAKRNDAGI